MSCKGQPHRRRVKLIEWPGPGMAWSGLWSLVVVIEGNIMLIDPLTQIH